MAVGGDRRIGQVSNLIRERLSRVLLEEVSDPRLQGVTLHDVIVSKDFKKARVFYGSSLCRERSEKEIQNGWKTASPFFKRRLGQGLGLRYVPELEFERDAHSDEEMRVHHLIEDLKSGPAPLEEE